MIGLGADKKKAEFAIGEFVKDIPKILASHTTEKNLDPTVPVSRGDIWRLEFVITEINFDLELKLAEIKNHLKLPSCAWRLAPPKNRNPRRIVDKAIFDANNF